MSQEVVITDPVLGSTYCAPITINDDLLVEGDEMFQVILTTSDNAIDLATTEAQVTIVDDDRKWMMNQSAWFMICISDYITWTCISIFGIIVHDLYNIILHDLYTSGELSFAC